MRYTQPQILNSTKATATIQDLGHPEKGGSPTDHTTDMYAFSDNAAYEADE
jgi:hypothetical protein